VDGTKIHANASRHSALSYEHAGKIEAQLKAEVAELLAKAEAADNTKVQDGLSIPEELARREERLKKLAPRLRRGRLSAREDRGACAGAIPTGAGRISSQMRRTRGQGRGHRQKTGRQSPETSGRDAAT
jgi:hypothetical protein